MKSNYTGLWLILVVSLLAVLFVALADDITLGTWTVKKAPFSETLFKDHSIPEPLEGEALTDSLQKEAEKVEAVTDSTPKSLLLIGDSMTLNLAHRLSRYAKQNGHSFHAVNWDSSNTKIWAESDTLQYFVNKFGADYVFISLGANELYLTKPEGHRHYVEKIISKIGNIPYVWIGPPNWKEDAGLNDMIQSVCEPGAFFRTKGMTFKRKKDGVHPTREASALWIDSVARWMPKSAHPILMDYPSDSIGKINPNVIFLKALNK